MMENIKPRSKGEMGFAEVSFKVYKQYLFVDGIISEDGDIKKTYYYFDPYNGRDPLIGSGEIAERDMVSIFKTQMTQDEKIYVSFASLDLSDEAQIMKWIEFFGIPVKEYPENIDKLENQPEPIEIGCVKEANQRPDKSDKGTLLPFFLSSWFCEAVAGYLQAFIDKEKAGVCRIVAVFRQNLNYAKDSSSNHASSFLSSPFLTKPLSYLEVYLCRDCHEIFEPLHETFLRHQN